MKETRPKKKDLLCRREGPQLCPKLCDLQLQPKSRILKMDLNPSSSLSHEHPPGSLCANAPNASQPQRIAARGRPMSLPPATEGTGPGPESSPQGGRTWEPGSLAAPRETWNFCLNSSQPRARPRTSPALSQIPNHVFTNRNTQTGLLEVTKYSSTRVTSCDQSPSLTDFTGLFLRAGPWA